MIPVMIHHAAAITHISINLLYSICVVETGMTVKNNFQDGHGRGSFGIAQVSLEVARSFKPEADRLALQQPSYNLLIAGMYLHQLMIKYNNNTYSAVSAYNAGLAWIDDGKYRNQGYVNRVMNIYSKLDN